MLVSSFEMISTNIPFSSSGLSLNENSFTATRTPGELNTYFHASNAALMPPPLFATNSQALLTRAKTIPTHSDSEELPEMLERSYIVNAAAVQANVAVNTNRHSRNLIDDFLKDLVDGPETPRNLIDDFLNELAQGSQPSRRTPRSVHILKDDMSPAADISMTFPSPQELTLSTIADLPESLKCAPAIVSIEATITAMIEELSSTTETCNTPFSVPRIPNNIPRRRPALDDLRIEYMRSSLESVSENALFVKKAPRSRARPLLRINTNIATLEDERLPELTQTNPSRPRVEKPRLTVNTDVSACHSNSSLERKAGEHARAFYAALISGEMDASAYMAADMTSPIDGLDSTMELETASAFSKTSLQLGYEKHEESFYNGLINGDSASDTSSKWSLSTNSSTCLVSPISPLSDVEFSVESEGPDTSSSSSESDTTRVTRVFTPLDGKPVLDKEEELCAARALPDSPTCETRSGSRRESELSIGSTSKVYTQDCSDGAAAARPCWNLRRAQSRRRRQTDPHHSSTPKSPFFHASR